MTPVIAGKQLDPLMESDGICGRLLRVRGSLRKDSHPQVLPFNGNPAALMKNKTRLLSQERKPFHMSGAQRSAVVRFCFWCLEDRREGEELTCSAQFLQEIINIDSESQELCEWPSSASWYFQKGDLSKT